MAYWTTLLLDEATKQAARQLALRYECSVSEAIRRAVILHRDTVFGLSQERRAERTRVLEHLFDLFEGHDAREEIRRLKAEDDGF